MPYERTEVRQPSGIVSDLSPFEITPQVWSGGDNVNFRRGKTQSSEVMSNPYPSLSLDVSPTYLQSYIDGEASMWLICADDTSDSVIATTDGTTVDVIGSGYSKDRDLSWTGCNFNGLMVVNNRGDVPQIILPPYTAAVDIPNWNATAPWGSASRCEVIRPYKNYLIAMDCYDEDFVHYPYMVRWSSPAQLGAAPVSWDVSVVGEQAGLYSLADTQGRVVDGLTLGDYFVIYKTDAVWLMQFIGGEFTMKFRKLFGDDGGILTKNCVTEFQGKHFVLSPTSCYVHNGVTKQDVMDGWVKDEFFTNVHVDYIQDTKVVADHNNNEIWVYYVSSANTEANPYADRALIWNWVEQSWTRRAIPQASFIAAGYVVPEESADDSWEGDSDSWASDTTLWNGDVNFSPILETLMFVDYQTPQFYALGLSTGTELFNPSSWVKRIGIDFDNDRRYKMVERIVPHIESSGTITITIFTSDVQDYDPVASATVEFDPSVDVDVDIHCVGRYIGIQFESEESFTLNGYTIEWKPTGSF